MEKGIGDPTMETNTRENTKIIKKMDMESINGLMAKYSKDTLSMEIERKESKDQNQKIRTNQSKPTEFFSISDYLYYISYQYSFELFRIF